MNKFKKNQIVVYSIVLMLVIAGYLNYIEHDNAMQISANTQNTTNIGDATLVSNNELAENKQNNETAESNSNDANINNNVNNEQKNNEKNTKISDEKNNNSNSDEEDKNNEARPASNVNTKTDEKDEYFASSKLEREKMYSQMLETYQKILENETISEEQKSIASNEITKINNNRNAIMICENLIAIKGFEEAVILANGESVNVVVKASKLQAEQIAQIQNIVTREIGVTIENIHIMTK